MKITPVRAAIVFSIHTAIVLSITGCANIPPEVQHLAANVRTNVADLHNIHAKDVRALAIVVNEREAALKEANCAVRRAFQKMLEADIAASKAKVLALFYQRAADVLGAEFQVRLQKEVYPKFDELERTNFDLLLKLEAEASNDLHAPEQFRAAQRALIRARSERQNVVGYYFIALATALNRERFNFETQLEQEYGALQTNVVAVFSATNYTDQALVDFNKRVDDDLALLDKSYNQLDQTLSDLSTDLDSKAASKRFATSFFMGVGNALMGDLKNGQFGAAALSQLLNSQAPGFVTQLNSIESKMLTQASQSVTNAVSSVPPPTP